MVARVLSTRSRGQKVFRLGTAQGPAWFQIEHSWPCQLAIGIMWKLLQWLKLLMGVTQMPSRAGGHAVRHAGAVQNWEGLGVVQSISGVRLCNPLDCSTPRFLFLHHLLELVQTHVHWVGDAIQLSHSLLSPSPPVFHLSQHQGFFLMSQFFASDSQNIGASASASVLPMNTQDWFPLGLTGLISLQSKWLSRVFFNTTVQKYQFFSVQPSL